ncbi:xylose isomerase-like protein [Desarmillaria ectypa]|nr:xylose isomerase-like protein [Desarmillaria ectypa]
MHTLQACSGYIIGSDFSHLADIIAAIEDKSRVVVFLDICHMFAAVSYESYRNAPFSNGNRDTTSELRKGRITKFDQQVALSYLRGMHLNDSKTDFRVEPGHIGLELFYHILTDGRVQGIPLILETPESKTWATETEVLNELSVCTKVDRKKKSQEHKVDVQVNVLNPKVPITVQAHRKRRHQRRLGKSDKPNAMSGVVFSMLVSALMVLENEDSYGYEASKGTKYGQTNSKVGVGKRRKQKIKERGERKGRMGQSWTRSAVPNERDNHLHEDGMEAVEGKAKHERRFGEPSLTHARDIDFGPLPRDGTVIAREKSKFTPIYLILSGCLSTYYYYQIHYNCI